MNFNVNAGKYESDGSRNYKYCDEFYTLEDAIAAHAKVSDYPWSEITMVDGDFVYTIDPVRTHRRTEVQTEDGPRSFFMPCDTDGNLIPQK